MAAHWEAIEVQEVGKAEKEVTKGVEEGPYPLYMDQSSYRDWHHHKEYVSQ